jgi:hypothetical protein
MFIRHRVSDYDTWRKAYDAFDKASRGVRGDAVYQEIDDTRDITVWHDFDDRQAAEAFAASEDLKAAMAEGGMEGAPTVWFTTAV